MAPCVLPGFNPALRQAGATTTTCGLGHLTDTVFCLRPSVLLFFEGFGRALQPLQSSDLVHVSSPCGVCSPFSSIYLSFTSPSLIGGNATPEKWPGRTCLFPQNISVGAGTLLDCVPAYFCLSRNLSNFSGAYRRVRMLLLLLSHHNFNKQVHLFSR